MTKRLNITSGSPWEDVVGYSRAVKAGNQIFVSGTTAVDEQGNVVAVGSSYLQTRYILQKIEQASAECGASMQNVVRTRIYTVNIADREEIGKAHAEFFRSIKPAATMVEVSNLIEPELLVEIEVDAVI